MINIFSVFSNLFHLILGLETPTSFPPPLPHAEETECFKRMEFTACNKHNAGIRLFRHSAYNLPKCRKL